MRILAVSNLFPNPFKPQLAVFNRRQFKALANEHEVKVIAPIAWSDELAARWAGKPTLPGDRRQVVDGMEVRHPRYIFSPKILRRFYGHFYLWSIRRTFARAVAEFRPDLVYATWAYPDGWAAVTLAHQARLPVVVKVHGSDILLLANQGGRRRGTVEALCRAEAVIAVSQDLAQRVVELGVEPAKVHLVYNGVDTTLFYPGSREESRRRLGLPVEGKMILFIGNLFPVKGIDVLVQACARLTKQGEEFTCHLIGQGHLEGELKRQIEALGLTNRIRMHGSVANERLPDWYRSANVFALPSRSEGVPNVLLEAMACGIPFVASRVGGIPEIAERGRSELVPANDATALAEALCKALKDDRAPEMGCGNVRSPRDASSELQVIFEQAIAIYRRDKVATSGVNEREIASSSGRKAVECARSRSEV